MHHPKLVFVTESQQIWGAENSLLVLLQELRRMGVETKTIVSVDSPLASVLESHDLPCERFRFANHAALSGGSLSSASTWDLLREPLPIVASAVRLRPLLEGYDVAIAFSLWQTAEVLLATKMARVPCILDLHETFSGKLSARIVRMASRVCAGTIAPSAAVLAANQLGSSSSISVVPRPVRNSSNIEIDLGAHRAYDVGIFGQVVPHKGVHHLVGAVESVAQGNVRLLVVGGSDDPKRRTEYEEDLRNRISALSGSEFVNRVEDVGNYMRDCKVVVNLSAHEAFGRTVIEALQAGAYPVVVEGGGPAEIVRDVGIGTILATVEDLVGMVDSLRGGEAGGTSLERSTWPRLVSRYEPESIATEYLSAISMLSKAK